jgi:hypothetical protein
MTIMPEQELLDLMEKTYEKEVNRTSDLDTKATSMITMAGTIATLFFGFGSLLLTDIPISMLEIYLPLAILLMSETILITYTIKYAVEAYKEKGNPYFSVITHDEFFDENYRYDPETTEKLAKLSKEFFNRDMIESYIHRTMKTYQTNEKKRDNIIFAQRLFNFSLGIIPVFAFVVVFYRLI